MVSMALSYVRMKDSTRGQRRASDPSGSATRSALLAAGRDCVREYGLAKTTSRLIAGAADVNLGSITYYFGSKEDLLAEALFGELSARLAPVLDTLESDDPAPGRLLGAVQDLIVEFENSAPDVPDPRRAPRPHRRSAGSPGRAPPSPGPSPG